MDEVTGAVAATGEIAKAATPLIENLAKLTGPLCEEMGLYFGDRVRAFRQKNITSVVEGSVEKLKSSGKPVNAVPPRLLIPIFEAASVEDNPTLQGMWSGLLASASDQTDALSPSFVETLKQLTPIEARSLKVLFDQPATDDLGDPAEVGTILMLGVRREVNEDFMPNIIVASFERLGLITRQYDLHKAENLPEAEAYTVPRGPLAKALRDASRQFDPPLPKLTYRLHFTYYGLDFMITCQGPRAADAV